MLILQMSIKKKLILFLSYPFNMINNYYAKLFMINKYSINNNDVEINSDQIINENSEIVLDKNPDETMNENSGTVLDKNPDETVNENSETVPDETMNENSETVPDKTMNENSETVLDKTMNENSETVLDKNMFSGEIFSKVLFEISDKINIDNLENKSANLYTINLKKLKYEIIKRGRLSRKIFCLDDNNKIYAGGALLYKYKNNSLYLLMGHPKIEKYYEDIGGKVDKCDDTIYDTIIRETSEETNNVINLTKKQLDESIFYYNNRGKYIISLIEANDEQQKMITLDFGNTELHDCIERTIHWVNINSIQKYNKTISPRLNIYTIAKYLDDCRII
jgi:hypothetical protein